MGTKLTNMSEETYKSLCNYLHNQVRRATYTHQAKRCGVNLCKPRKERFVGASAPRISAPVAEVPAPVPVQCSPLKMLGSLFLNQDSIWSTNVTPLRPSAPIVRPSPMFNRAESPVACTPASSKEAFMFKLMSGVEQKSYLKFDNRDKRPGAKIVGSSFGIDGVADAVRWDPKKARGTFQRRDTRVCWRSNSPSASPRVCKPLRSTF